MRNDIEFNQVQLDVGKIMDSEILLLVVVKGEGTRIHDIIL